MAAGSNTNFIIYPELVETGVIETLQQNVEIFNGASLNCVNLVTQSIRGDYEKQSFMKYQTSSISHRDPTSFSAVTDGSLAMDETVGVKVNKRIGPAMMTRDAFKKRNVSPEQFSYEWGVQWGTDLSAHYCNNAIAAVNAAIANQGSALTYDNTVMGGTTTGNVNAFSKARQLFGDKSARLKLAVMHSNTYFQLEQQNIADKVVNVADVTIWTGSIATLGMPALVIDSPSLLVTGGSSAPANAVLFLAEGAIELTESEEREVQSLPVLGQENLGIRIQGEFAYNVRVKGCSWDLTNGGINPNDASLATAAYWLKKANDIKNMPGTRVLFHQ